MCFPVAKGVDSAGDCPYMVPVVMPDLGVRFVKVVADQGLFALLDTHGGVWCWSAYRPVGGVGDTPTCVVSAGAVDIAVSATCFVCVMSSGEAFVFGASKFAVTPPGSEEGYVACTASGPTIMLLAQTRRTVHIIHCRNTTALSSPLSPKLVPLVLAEGETITDFSRGSIVSAVCTSLGHVYTWGDGASGALGLGGKTPEVKLPQRVPRFDGSSDDLFAVSVACTKGQENPNRTGKAGGQEGPRTHVTTRSGRLCIAGTCHKGMGADHLHKTMAPKEDHTSFYEVGGVAADRAVKDAVPTGAAEDLRVDRQGACRDMAMQDGAFGEGGRTHYLEDAHIVASGCAHIHSAALAKDGRLFSWGCGSNGRCGLPAFMRGPGGSKRRMKCYVSSPTAVPIPGGGKVLDIALGKYWTLALVEKA